LACRPRDPREGLRRATMMGWRRTGDERSGDFQRGRWAGVVLSKHGRITGQVGGIPAAPQAGTRAPAGRTGPPCQVAGQIKGSLRAGFRAQEVIVDYRSVRAGWRKVLPARRAIMPDAATPGWPSTRFRQHRDLTLHQSMAGAIPAWTRVRGFSLATPSDADIEEKVRRPRWMSARWIDFASSFGNAGTTPSR